MEEEKQAIEETPALAFEDELPPEEAAEQGPPDVEMSAEIEKNLMNIIEALLFASDEPLSAQSIKDILRVEFDARRLRTVILDLNKRLQADRRPFEITEVAGGFQFRTIAAYQKYLKGLFRDKAIRRLSAQALETLAIIAYKQPVSKAEIEGIRNVSTDGAMKTLLERRLIKILGKSEEKPGKPIVYGTTRDFLKYFGLNRISDLPKLEEFEEIAKAQEKDLIHDFKRDTEKTHTLGPEAEAQAGDNDAPTADNEPLSPTIPRPRTRTRPHPLTTGHNPCPDLFSLLSHGHAAHDPVPSD
ncbi:MAG: SMC-Scp complex subunit ScpB [Fibrobacterota bacterium]